MVKIILNNLTSKIIGYLPDEVHARLDKTLSYRVQNARFSPLFKAKKWDGIVHLYYRNRGQSFYSGLLSFVEPILEENKIPYQKVDERIRPAQNLPHLVFTPPENYEERDYQQFTIQRALQRTRGILKIATGGGKTNVAVEMIAAIKTSPFMFYVLTEDLLRQAHEVLFSTLNEPIGIIGGGEFDIRNINVCTIQTAIRAIHSEEKIKISDYRFDEEDEWDKKDILSMENRKKLKNLIYNLKGIYADECISGNVEIVTEFGKIRIDEAVKNKCKFVQTYDGNNIVFRPILNWWDKGIKQTFIIKLSNGKEITCTNNHLFFTKRGWIQAKNLKRLDFLLYANVDAEKQFQLQTNTDLKDLYWDIKSKKEPKNNGLITMDSIAKYKNQKNTKKYYTISNLILKNLENYQHMLKNMFQNVCPTNWMAIKSIRKDKIPKRVYDIEVKDTHCFFANNILVHNCHHTSARTVREVLSASPNAFWRYGGSATPYREDGAEIIIQGLFGKKIVDINASYLIKQKYLVKPYIIFDPIDDNCNFHSYPSVYKSCIADNNSFNMRVVEIAKYLISRGLSILILVKQYKQGEYIKSLLDNVDFLTGKMTRNSRKKSLQEIKNGIKKCIIGTTLFDEGIDCPCLDAVLMAGGGASSTRVYQRIGRTLRLKGQKNKALVVYFEHNAKHLEKHAKKARKIMKEEPEFEIIKSSGGDFIFDDINQIFEFSGGSKSIFSTIQEMSIKSQSNLT